MSTWKIFHFETKPWRKQVKFFLIWEGARRSKKILIHSRSVFTQRNVNSWIGDSLLINLVAFLVTLKIDLGRIGPLVFTGG